MENNKIILLPNDFQILNYCKNFFFDLYTNQSTNKFQNTRNTIKSSKS